MLDSIQLGLIQSLSDGAFHNGSDLGEKYGVSRSAISKRIIKLKEIGLEVDSIKGKGYKLRYPVELLSEGEIRSFIDPANKNRIEHLVLNPVTDSTNSDAMLSPNVASYSVFVSEYQKSGRGRRGKSWYQGYASSLTFSIVRDYDLELKKLGVMSLWAAIAIAECLNENYQEKVMIKWPNDIYVGDKKLAGILLEAKAEVRGLARLVIGIGINYSKYQIDSGLIDQLWISLSELTPKEIRNKNEVFALILSKLIGILDAAEFDSYLNLKNRWHKFDLLVGKEVVVSSHKNSISGIGRGIDEEGNLVVEKGGSLVSLNAGEVSVRMTK